MCKKLTAHFVLSDKLSHALGIKFQLANGTSFEKRADYMMNFKEWNFHFWFPFDFFQVALAIGVGNLIATGIAFAISTSQNDDMQSQINRLQTISGNTCSRVFSGNFNARKINLINYFFIYFSYEILPKWPARQEMQLPTKSSSTDF